MVLGGADIFRHFQFQSDEANTNKGSMHPKAEERFYTNSAVQPTLTPRR